MNTMFETVYSHFTEGPITHMSQQQVTCSRLSSGKLNIYVEVKRSEEKMGKKAMLQAFSALVKCFSMIEFSEIKAIH